MSVELTAEQRSAFETKFGADGLKLIELFLKGLENSQLGQPHLRQTPVGIDFNSVRVESDPEKMKKIVDGLVPAAEWKARELPAATHVVCFETTGKRPGYMLVGHFNVDKEPRLVRIGEHPITRK